MQNQKFPKEKAMNQNPQNRSFNDATTTIKDNKTTYGTKLVTTRTMNIQQIIWWYHRVSMNHHLVAACYHTQVLAATQHLPHYYNMLPKNDLLIVFEGSWTQEHLKVTIQQGTDISVNKSPKWHHAYEKKLWKMCARICRNGTLEWHQEEWPTSKFQMFATGHCSS